MTKRTILYVILGIVAIAAAVTATLLLTQPGAEAEGETRSAMVERGTLLVAVSASGSVEPQARAGLTFEIPGRVTDVRAKAGDNVKAGNALVQLDTGQVELQIHQAQAALALAEAQLAQLQAGARPGEIAAAEANLRAAQARVSGAIASLDQLKAGPTQAQIAAAQAQVAAAKLQYELAQDSYDRIRSQTKDEEKLESAGYDLYVAEEALAAAQAGLDDLLAGAGSDELRAAQAGVWAATAQQDAAQAQLDLLLAGPTEEQIADAEAQVERAQAALEQAELALERATLRAPFDGFIAQVNVSIGEMAPAGLPAITLLDTSGFRVATSVDELDVGRLTEGQTAQVTLDALPDTVLAGTVKSIAPAARFEGGVVYYDIIIALAPTDVPVRAGMTANVTIVIEELTDILIIPTWVVRVDQRTGQTYVDRQVGDHTERVDVSLGVRHQGVAQVLGGLSEGDVAIWIPDTEFNFGGHP